MTKGGRNHDYADITIIANMPIEDQRKHVITILVLFLEIIRVIFVSNISANDLGLALLAWFSVNYSAS